VTAPTGSLWLDQSYATNLKTNSRVELYWIHQITSHLLRVRSNKFVSNANRFTCLWDFDHEMTLPGMCGVDKAWPFGPPSQKCVPNYRHVSGGLPTSRWLADFSSFSSASPRQSFEGYKNRGSVCLKSGQLEHCTRSSICSRDHLLHRYLDVLTRVPQVC
jgi:hypothetical protein